MSFMIRHRVARVSAAVICFIVAGAVVLGTPGTAQAGAPSVQANVHHVIISLPDQEAAAVKVREVVELENTGSEASDPVALSLPEGYMDLTPASGMSGAALELTETGVLTATGLAPGEMMSLVYTYYLPVSPEGAGISRVLSVPTAYMVLYVEHGTLEATIEGAQSSDIVTLMESSYRRFYLQALDSGATISFQLDRGSGDAGGESGAGEGALPTTGSVPGQQQQPEGRGIGSLALVIALAALFGLGVFWALRSRIGDPVTAPATAPTGDPSTLHRERQIVLDKLALLEKRYQEGSVEEGVYEPLRKRYKEELLGYLSQLEAYEKAVR